MRRWVILFVIGLWILSIFESVVAYSSTYDVVLWDDGPSFYDTRTVGSWPAKCTFVIRGELVTYSTSWYQGEGCTELFIPFLGYFIFSQAIGTVENSDGFRDVSYFSKVSFVKSFYYPYPRDGPSSTLTVGWHYKHYYYG
ncbi:hypothetical protein VFC49_03735 [Thermococcus sp. SY098]|uniref:hypothetical protein n=1 Tax=Thermococcus sp. SY098 TaxID=3111325 RepID=UPI002D7716D3|nr:hypothetical protein [Thermococcus sp. SY098]WRS53238.1 hypothetical protein VFC49_03735 [Thermococcus sp. SY098]